MLIQTATILLIAVTMPPVGIAWENPNPAGLIVGTTIEMRVGNVGWITIAWIPGEVTKALIALPPVNKRIFIRAKFRDKLGRETRWSFPLEILIPRRPMGLRQLTPDETEAFIEGRE